MGATISRVKESGSGVELVVFTDARIHEEDLFLADSKEATFTLAPRLRSYTQRKENHNLGLFCNLKFHPCSATCSPVLQEITYTAKQSSSSLT